MELLSLVTIIIITVVLVSTIRLLAHSLKFVLFSLLAVLLAVYLFGISYMDIIGVVVKVLLWVI